MMAKKSTKLKRAGARTPEQIEAAKVTAKAKEIGVPTAQIERGNLKIHDVKLNVGERAVTFSTVRKSSALERWFVDGGQGFEAPQAQAVAWVQGLWRQVGSEGPRIASSSWGDARGGGVINGQKQDDALVQLSLLKTAIPLTYWNVFEDVVRNNVAAGVAGEDLTKGTRPHDYARACVGFVASIIAMRRGF